MRVMVCHDGTDRAQKALEKALALFRHAKPEIVIVTVVEPPLDATSEEDESFEKWRARRDADLREAAEWTANQGFNVDALLAVGDPRKMIIEAAAKKEPAMIILGRRGDRPIEKLELGSVAAYVTRHARFPVTIV